MDNGYTNESMLDVFLYETTQNIEQLEEEILASEKAKGYTPDRVNEIFRIMHTIKGSAAMMMYNNIALVAHSIEDLFYYLREEQPQNLDYRRLSDIVLEGVDFIKLELEKVKNSDPLDGDPGELTDKIKEFLNELKGEVPEKTESQVSPAPRRSLSEGRRMGGGGEGEKEYEAVVYFEEDCKMENMRSFSIIHHLEKITRGFQYYPEDIADNPASAQTIREQGFRIRLRTDKSPRELYEFFMGTAFVKDLEINELVDTAAEPNARTTAMAEGPGAASAPEARNQSLFENRSTRQSMISVDVIKLDKLMDLMGEMVIAEAMVTQNPELQTLKLNSFYKAARQLKKITGEMQDMVMSIRMVPLTATFHKMNRIVRDMSRKLNKKVELQLIGEETEVDKNIIEHISDPLMHLVRNSVDHGIEDADAREARGKRRTGQVTLEAANSGGDVIITVRDDGQGLDKERILKKAAQSGLLTKPAEEMLDREIYNLIFLPGFSTNSEVTEFSGRGVGMDVVMKNLEAVGGSVSVDSAQGVGTVTTLKIPLTLAIIDGMNIRVGKAIYTLPTTSIQETFRARPEDLIRDPEGNEMIMVRGLCYPILRLHELFAVQTEVTDLTQGIMLMIEQEGKCRCLFADELLGQHQVVVKALPAYMKSIKKVEGLAGCTLLGDGSISLILNVGGLVNM